MRRHRKHLRIAKFEACHLLFLLVFAACSSPDPSRDMVVEALGSETPGVKVGPLHRPGQPCLACHRDSSSATPFSVAGTVYKEQSSLIVLPDVGVELTDVKGRTHKAVTNCAGNFFIRPSEFEPTYPLWVTLRLGTVTRKMESPIFRDGSCSSCHKEKAGPDSAGAVFLIKDNSDPVTLPTSRCAGARQP